MLIRRAWLSISASLVAGVAIGWFFNAKQPVFAGGGTDRHEDFILATGPINQSFSNNPNAQFLNAELDGVWMLDYKSGKLLANTINRQTGKMIGFGEVDLVKEFEIAPRANVHFIMSTGNVIKGQSVLYLVETSTGKMGVYSMLSNETANTANGSERVLIRRHDMVSVRNNNLMNSMNNPMPVPGQAVPNTKGGYPVTPNMPNAPMPQLPPDPVTQTGGFPRQ